MLLAMLCMCWQAHHTLGLGTAKFASLAWLHLVSAQLGQNHRHSVNSICAAMQASSRLTHLLPNEDMTDAKADFASNHIADMVFESLRASDANAVSQLLQASASFPDASILRGRVFERWAHHRLQVGGSFRARAAGDGT